MIEIDTMNSVLLSWYFEIHSSNINYILNFDWPFQCYTNFDWYKLLLRVNNMSKCQGNKNIGNDFVHVHFVHTCSIHNMWDVHENHSDVGSYLKLVGQVVMCVCVGGAQSAPSGWDRFNWSAKTWVGNCPPISYVPERHRRHHDNKLNTEMA